MAETRHTRSMIYGAGSLGTVLGVLLTAAGEDVLLVSHNRAHVEAMRASGAAVTGCLERRVSVRAALPEDISGHFDVIFLMIKQQDNPRIVRELTPYLGADGVLCCLQNGVPEEALRGVLPDSQLVGGVVAWSATYEGPGVSRLTSLADTVRFTVGSPYGTHPDAVERVRRVLAQAGPAEVDGDILSMRWSKLLVNASVSALSSSLGLPCGGVTHDPRFQPLVLRALRECVDVGRAEGVVFRSVNGWDIARELYVPAGGDPRPALEKLPDAFDSIRASESAVLQDLRRGRKTETEAITGVVCRTGRRLGIPTPCNDRILRTIHRVERGELPCSSENLREYQEFLTAPF